MVGPITIKHSILFNFMDITMAQLFCLLLIKHTPQMKLDQKDCPKALFLVLLLLLFPLNHTSTPVERKKALTPGRRDEKIQAAQLGIELR